MGNNYEFMTAIPTYRKQETFHSIAFGQVTRISNSKTKALAKVIICADQQQRDSYTKCYYHRKSLLHPSILQIIQIKQFQSESSCNSGSPFLLAFQDYDYTVRQYLKNISDNKLQVSQQFIWNFIQSIVKGVVFLNKQATKSVFLSIDTVLLKDMKPKIPDHLLSKYRHPYFQVFQQKQRNRQYFLPPECIKNIGFGRCMPQLSIKGQFYSIGVLVLMLMTKSVIKDLYSQQNLTLQNHKIRSCINKLNCTQQLKQLIRGFLQQQIQSRLDYCQFLYLIQHHKRQMKQQTLKKLNRLQTQEYASVQKQNKTSLKLQQYQTNSVISNLSRKINQKPQQIIQINPTNLMLHSKNQKQFIGDIINGKRQGYGVIKYTNGNVFKGLFKKGIPHGIGHFIGTKNLIGIWYNGKFQSS